jgi:hypothetical protein
MHVNVFDFSELLARSPKRHLEFIRVSTFSVGIYVLDSGATDLQTPHSEDEVYYVVSGHAKMRTDLEGDFYEPWDHYLCSRQNPPFFLRHQRTTCTARVLRTTR